MMWRFLRSRRLAIALLIGITIYTLIVTLVPSTEFDPAAAAAWDAEHPVLASVVNALGLHSAYSSPLFVVVAILLTASTAACSWERTRAAMRGWQAHRGGSQRVRSRLLASPSLAVELDPAMGEDQTYERVLGSIAGLGLRVRRVDDVLVGSGGALGLVGSPLFHWALVGLFIFAGAGQLTKYEGYVNMIEGDSFADAPETYTLSLTRAPLAGEEVFTGVSLAVERIDFDHPLGGATRGRAPLVTLARDGVELGRAWVYPNHPLRYGPLMIQRATSGPALLGTVETDATFEAAPVRLYYDEQSKAARGFRFVDPATGKTLSVEVTPVGGQRVEVIVRPGGKTHIVGAGESVPLVEGAEFTLDALTYYVQLQVVNDWSVPWIYAMFIGGTIGMALTTFVPPRAIHAMVTQGGEGPRLHVVIDHRRSDPAFPRLAERAIERHFADQGGSLETGPPERKGTV